MMSQPEIALELSFPFEESAVRARRSAIAPLRQRVEELLSGMKSFPEACVTISHDQFANCILELGIDGCEGAFAGLLTELAGLDLGDAKVIGGPARRLLADHVAALDALDEALRELARFRVDGPAGELREASFELGPWAASAVLDLMDLLTAGSDDEVDSEVLQERLDASPLRGRLGDLWDQLPELEKPDDNARVSALTGRQGDYTDEFGRLEPQKVWGAFSNDPQPLKAAGDQASAFFNGVLGQDAISSSSAALLALPATMIATLDRPLRAHRMVRLAYELLMRAHQRNPEETEAVIQEIAKQSQKLMAVGSRIQSSFRILAQGAEAGEVDDETMVAGLLNSYRELVESNYRVLGHAATELGEIAAGRPARKGNPPMARDLSNRLSASDEPALRELGSVVDVDLRNAVAHSQWHLSEATAEVEDLDTGQTWTDVELERVVDDMVAVLAGADAGFSCGLVAADIDMSTSWALKEGPTLVTLTASMLFATNGYEVDRIEDGGATVVLGDTPEDQAGMRMLGLLAGLSVMAEAERYSVKSSSADAERDVITVDADSLRWSREAPPELKDLGAMEVMANAAINSGRDPEAIREQLLAAEAKVIAVTANQQVGDGRELDDVLVDLRIRIEHLRRLAKASAQSKTASRLLGKLDRIEESVEGAEEESAEDVRRLADRLSGLSSWADKRFITWPPELATDALSGPEGRSAKR